MSTAVEKTRFGWSRWAESEEGLERTYTICEPDLGTTKRDLIHLSLFRDDRRGMIQLASRWLVRGILVALALGGLVALLMQSTVVIIPISLSVLVAAGVLFATLPNFGRRLAENHTITVSGDACRELSRIAAILDRIEPDPTDVDRDDARTMWRLARTDPKFLGNYGRTVRDWEVSYDRLRATLAGQESKPAAMSPNVPVVVAAPDAA